MGDKTDFLRPGHFNKKDINLTILLENLHL